MKARAQGLSEYLVVLIALVVAAIAAVTVFGPVISDKVATYTLN